MEDEPLSIYDQFVIAVDKVWIDRFGHSYGECSRLTREEGEVGAEHLSHVRDEDMIRMTQVLISFYSKQTNALDKEI